MSNFLFSTYDNGYGLVCRILNLFTAPRNCMFWIINKESFQMQNFSSTQVLLLFPSLNKCNSICKLNISESHLMSLFQQLQRSTFLLLQSVLFSILIFMTLSKNRTIFTWFLKDIPVLICHDTKESRKYLLGRGGERRRWGVSACLKWIWETENLKWNYLQLRLNTCAFLYPYRRVVPSTGDGLTTRLMRRTLHVMLVFKGFSMIWLSPFSAQMLPSPFAFHSTL